MKKHQFVLALFAFMMATQASVSQTMVAQGSLLGNGSFSFQAFKSKGSGPSAIDENQTSMSFSPWAGYFIIDNLGLGGSLNVSSATDKYDTGSGEYKNSLNSVTFGPVIRFYFAEGPFVQGYLGVGSGTSKSSGDGFSQEFKSNITEFQTGLGYSVRISDTILLDPFIGYNSTAVVNKDDKDDKDKITGIFFSLGFSLILVSK